MKPFDEISRLGRLRRMRHMAREALKAYGLEDARLTFLTYHGNVIYRVDARRAPADLGGMSPVGSRRAGGRGLHASDRFVLRLHMDYHSEAAIRSELEWLRALRNDGDMPVPEPVPTSRGELILELPVPGSSAARKCSLLRWLDGRFIRKGFRAAHARAWGRLMARLHEHALNWRLPEGFTRRRNDWNGMFGDGARFEFPAADLWDAVPARFRRPFETVTAEVRRVMDDLGQGLDVFGLVHSDLDVKTNVLFSGKEAGAIDFDDSGFAYWLHDLAFALSPWQGSREEEWVQDALLEGYSGIRTFPDSQLAHLDLFKAAFNATLMLWMLDWAKLVPGSRAPKRQLDMYGANLMRYFEQC